MWDTIYIICGSNYGSFLWTIWTRNASTGPFSPAQSSPNQFLQDHENLFSREQPTGCVNPVLYFPMTSTKVLSSYSLEYCKLAHYFPSTFVSISLSDLRLSFA